MIFDYQLFKLINDFATKNLYLDWLGIFAAKYLIFVIVAISLSLFIRNRLAAINAFISSIIALAINYLISLIYFRPRPFVSHLVNLLISKPASDKSFPSDHTALAFALAFSIYFSLRQAQGKLNKKLGIFLLVLALIVGLGRIYVGVHYPLDILGGILVGFLTAFLVKRVKKK